MNNPMRVQGHLPHACTPITMLAVAVLSFAVTLTASTARAQGAERSGKQVVDATCGKCHTSGANGAPKIGDNAAWSKLASRGLSGLTQSALKGIRSMPAHGGDAKLSDTEIERAITYMVNQSGGKWVEPISRTQASAERSGEQIVKEQCAKCHQSGTGGAPKIGDRAAWTPRMKQGIDVVVRSAIQGHGGMPARGGMANLTDAEMKAAVSYMFNPVPKASKAASAPAPVRDANSKIVDGTEISLGVLSAETIRAQHPKPDAESKMHGGIPSGKGYYHVNISLRDSGTKAAIKDAEVEARVADPMSGETKKLELVTLNNAASYGNYFRMQGKGPYTIAVQVRRPGAARTLEAKFDFRPE